MNTELKENVSYSVAAFNANGKMVRQTIDSGFRTVEDCFNVVKSNMFTIRELHVSSDEEGLFVCVHFDEDEKEIQD